jgi:glycogen phosphorylase
MTLQNLPPQLAALGALALDLRWTWSHEADALWQRIDAASWEQTRNPWAMLQDLSPARMRELARDRFTWTSCSASTPPATPT